jgi:hypothetical protein
MPDDIHDTLARALADIGGRLGAAAFEDRRKVLALLADAMAGHNRQLRLLGIAFDNGAVRAIATARADQVDLEIDRHAQRVDADLGIRKSITVPVLRAVAFAAGRGGLPSLYAPAESSDVARPAPVPEESWIGVTRDPPSPAPVIAPPPGFAPAAAPAPQPAPLAPAPSPSSPPAPQPAARPEPRGLGGWLIAWPVVLLLLGAVLGLVGVEGVVTILAIARDGNFQLLLPDLLILAPAMAVLGALALLLLWLHFRRSRRARLANGLWLIALAGLLVYGTAFANQSAFFMPWWVAAPPLAVCVIGLGYFLRSRRARNTFVR